MSENQKRLIDAYAIIDDIQAAKNNNGLGAVIAGTFIRYVKRCPTVDAVEVVRCKNCRHCERKVQCEYDHYTEYVYRCTYPFREGYVNANGFCDKGDAK